MNIGFITPWYERGAGIVSKQYIDILKKENDIFIYAKGGEHIERENSSWVFENVTIGRRVPGYSRDRINFKHLKNWIESNKIEIIFFNEQVSWEIIYLLKKNINSIPIGLYVDYYTEETVPLFDIYDFLICNTQKHFRVFSWHSNAIYVPWGSHADLLKNNFSVKGKDAPIFFHSCGYNTLRKGTDLLLYSFSKIKNNNIKLIIHTQYKILFEDEYLNDILKNDKRIEVIDRTVSLPGLYHLADVYVYPTRLEGIGLTVPEALMSGLPCIVPDDSPMNEFVEHERNGYLVNVERFVSRRDAYYWPQCIVDIEDLTKAMEYYIDNYRHLAAMKEYTYKQSREKLDWNKNADNLSDIFKKQKTKKTSKKTLEMVFNYDKKKMGCKRELFKRIMICLPVCASIKSILYDIFLERKWKRKMSG